MHCLLLCLLVAAAEFLNERVHQHLLLSCIVFYTLSDEERYVYDTAGFGLVSIVPRVKELGSGAHEMIANSAHKHLDMPTQILFDPSWRVGLFSSRST